MSTNVDLSIAINILNKKIAEINMKILENNIEENQEELDKYLNIKKEIYQGNMLWIKKVINGEI